MNNQKEKLQEIIENSSLSEEQVSMWKQFMESLDNELIAPIVETVEDDPEMLLFLTKNVEQKIQALNSERSDDWDNIMQQEKDLLNKIKDE